MEQAALLFRAHLCQRTAQEEHEKDARRQEVSVVAEELAGYASQERRAGDLAGAIETLQAALSICESEGSTEVTRATYLAQIGDIQAEEGAYSESLASHLDAAQLYASQPGFSYEAARSFHSAATASEKLNDPGGAISLLELSVEQRRLAGDWTAYGMGSALESLGTKLAERDPETARRYLDVAADLHHSQ
ncbi:MULTISPECIES: hypothetical protein [Actinomyces]|uniref:Tetratricopeptide repeat protein n=1 Tax=Actinomyces respiraculi TaxID=2744574 RepID=A0A7T0PVP4_9ACTO|nr:MULTISPECIES: hypothetical protein [Actinomyces]QPL04929.1 hypothetical protein ID810_09275 [Actinomyces respiraculi]